MEDSAAILIVIAVVAALILGAVLFLVPEPSQRSVVATDRLDLAILGFSNSSTWNGIGETVRGRLENALVNEAGVNVFSRAQLDSLLAEQMMSQSGLIDVSTAVSLGSLIGVNKLVTGAVYAVDTRSEASTVCLAWENGACTTEAPGTTYSVRVFAQISVVSTVTGKIEQSLDASGTDSITLPADTTFGGFDSLMANAAQEIAATISATLAETYTRELRYGLYDDVESKRDGFVGKAESNRFPHSSGEIYLLIHVTRAQSSELFDVEWSNADGSFSVLQEDVISDGDWRRFELNVTDLPAGRYRVRGILNGTDVLEIPFTIIP